MEKEKVKVDQAMKGKLNWLAKQMFECQTKIQCYQFNYNGILNSVLLNAKADIKKKWTYDDQKGVLSQVEEKDNGSSTNVDNAKQ